jgi:NADH dehydrogenase/NADH:ubiquinone oxidoreductase subunit G
MRITRGIARPAPVEILVDDLPVAAHEGESLATALLAAGIRVFSHDTNGRPRSPYCNMGVCFDCMVTLESASGARRVRACLTAVTPGLRVRIAAHSESLR